MVHVRKTTCVYGYVHMSEVLAGCVVVMLVCLRGSRESVFASVLIFAF